MRTKTYTALVAALTLLPALSQAELKHVADEELSAISGQSGLLIEVGAGTISYANATDIIDWSQSGVQIDATKWIWDLEEYNSDTNIHTETATGQLGGVINMGVKVAGRLDLGVDGVLHASGSRGGIAPVSYTHQTLPTN